MGFLRLKMQFDKSFGQYIGEIVAFLVLVFFTIWFTFTYLKRVLYMAFLTLISPMVALTYCIDKTNDGQAQGFNMWLKEYIFNLLLQPVHLLLYFILVTSAFELAGKNVLYSLVALGFMIPAEKLLRSMFGFSKAKTPPLLGGPVGTSLTMQALDRLSGRIRGGGSHNNSIGGRNSSKEQINPPDKTREARNVGELVGGNTEEDTLGTEETTSGVREAHLIGEENYSSEFTTQPSSLPINSVPVNSVPENDDEIRMAQIPNLGENNQLWEQTNGMINLPETNKKKINRPVGFVKDKYKNIDIKPNRIGVNTTRKNNTNKLASKKWKRAKKNAKIAGAVAGIGAKKVAKGALGIAAGTALATGVGAIAGAAAIASGDPSKVATAGGTALATGYAVGRNTANAQFNSDSIFSPEVRQAIDDVKNSSEYKEDRMEDYIKSVKNNKKIQQDLREIDKNIAERMIKNGNFDEYMRLGYGVDKEGLKQMVASERLIEDTSEPRINTAEDAAGVKKTSERMGDLLRMDIGKQNKWKQTFSEEYKNAGVFNDDESADRGAQKTIDLAKKYQNFVP